jgi:uncharacterized membrane protein YesL
MNFNISDNVIARGLARFLDFILLNVLFIVCSLPIITIGASTTAMYTVMLKIVKDEEGYIAKGFLQAFKENLKKGTIAWLIILPVNLVIYFNIFLSTELPILSNVFIVLFIVLGMISMFGCVYIFPLIARYESPLKNTFKNAFLLAIGRLPYTIALVIINVVPFFITFLDYRTFVFGLVFWPIIGFSIVAWLSSMILRRVFVILDEKEEEL